MQKARLVTGEISHHRWRVIESHIRTQLSRYVGTSQITLVTEERWKTCLAAGERQGRSGGLVSKGTIRDEMQTFRGVMGYAASKGYIKESQIPKKKLPFAKERCAEFTPQEVHSKNDLHFFHWNQIDGRSQVPVCRMPSRPRIFLQVLETFGAS
jgi:integrase